jgi:hypothetical protein
LFGGSLLGNGLAFAWLGFEKMCKGWAKGSNDFKQAVMADLKGCFDASPRVQSDSPMNRQMAAY